MSDDGHPTLPGFGSGSTSQARPGTALPPPGQPAVWVGRGPREVEAALLDAVGGWSLRVASEPSQLATPLRLVVPSRSLRDHVMAVAARTLGKPLVGVSVQTLFSTALEVLERASRSTPSGRDLYSLLVRRQLRTEPSLQAPLGGLPEAHRVVEASVDDLLDAGLAPEHEQPLGEALDELEMPGAVVERAKAVVRIALAVRAALTTAGRAHRSQLLERACDALERDPTLLPASEVWIHGFAEATGRATDLLLAIGRARPTTLLVDEPPEPGVADSIDPGTLFTHRLREHFEGLGGRARTLPTRTSVAAPGELLAAPGAEAEVRAVAGRIRALLDSEPALAPESLAVVARQVGPYAHALRAHFGRLGIPYSGVAATVAAGAPARRAAALAALLEEGDRCGADRWVEVLCGIRGRAEGPSRDDDTSLRADLRLGLRHLGAGRLRDVARLEAPAGALKLPIRSGLRAPEDEAGAAEESGRRSGGSPTAEYRKLGREVVQGAIGRARSLCERLASAPETAVPGSWDDWLRALLTQDLGWSEADTRAQMAGGLAPELPGDLELSRAEAFALLAERLQGSGARESIGGEGGGVAILDVMESRARTFDHLFLLGLNREVFPRAIREDPLLPDAVRRPLLVVLPDLPIKAGGHDEERYLFAQLAASSDHMVLSWQRVSDDGRERVRSTFIDRLRSRQPATLPVDVPAVHDPALLREPGGATARELAIWAGVGAGPAEYEARIADALVDSLIDEAGDGMSASRVARLAGARARCVREYSRFEIGPAALGPFMGLLGPASEAADLRGARRYVTSFESMAYCPWKAALEKLLRLEAPPDPLDSFPELDALIVGSAVHRVLEQLLDPNSGGSGPRRLTAMRETEPRVVPWPSPDDVAEMAERCAREQLEAQGFPYPGLVRVLAERVGMHVERARSLWDSQAVTVLGAEVEGVVEVADEDGAAQHSLAFRADLVERVGGSIRLTDYKTGNPVSDRKKPDVRARHFRDKVAQGRLLQAVAYGLASGGERDVGRYLFLRPDLRPELAEVRFEAGGAESVGLELAFRSAVSTLGRAWDAGVFPPRLTEVDHDRTAAPCRSCELSSACLQGDTGTRQRQRDWVDSARKSREAGTLSELEARYLEIWELPVAEGAVADAAGAAEAGEGAS